MNINFIAPFGNTGYGIVSKYLYTELYKNHDIIPFPIGQSILPDSKEQEDIFKVALSRRPYFHHDGHCIKIWHEYQLQEKIGNGQYLAYPFFEMDRFDNIRKHHINYPDKILVSSQWAKDIVLQYRDNVHIVNPGVDSSVFYPNDANEPRPYTFLVMGKWEKRKGHDIIPEAFRKAFSKTDDVKLIMATYNPFNNAEENRQWEDRYLGAGLGQKVEFIRGPMGQHHNVAALMNRADCGIFVSRAEGWNMELMEMMACGKSVIATNFSAHTEYVNNNNAFLIDIDTVEDAYDGKWFNGEGKWASLAEDQVDQLIEHMRYCYKEQFDNVEGVKTAHKFSWENSARQVVSAISA